MRGYDAMDPPQLPLMNSIKRPEHLHVPAVVNTHPPLLALFTSTIDTLQHHQGQLVNECTALKKRCTVLEDIHAKASKAVDRCTVLEFENFNLEHRCTELETQVIELRNRCTELDARNNKSDIRHFNHNNSRIELEAKQANDTTAENLKKSFHQMYIELDRYKSAIISQPQSITTGFCNRCFCLWDDEQRLYIMDGCGAVRISPETCSSY